MKSIILCFYLFFIFSFSFAQQAPLGKFLSKQYLTLNDDDQALVFVSFTDKGDIKKHRVAKAQSFVSERSLKRRLTVLSPEHVVDERDFPLEQSYVQAVASMVSTFHYELKWFNSVSVVATKRQITALRALPFVKEIELVGRWKTRIGDEQESILKETPLQPTTNGINSLDYGTSFTQVNQINVPAVHNLGIYGQGVVVGVFDNGFRLLNHETFSSMNIIATHDFVDHKESVIPNHPTDPLHTSDWGGHGTNTLSTVGGSKPGQLIGPAFKASYILARTENDSSETPIEEDNWAKAIEWADSIGVDVTSTSLGYLTYDPPYTSWTWENMDGHTSLITKAADRAVSLGIVVVNSAGNSGIGDGIHNTLGAPSDGDSVIAAGAVTAAGVRSSFSSVGPTADGRIKPDVMAMGSGVKVASSTNPTGYGVASGTSFSCPLSAGVAALIRCANPNLTPMQVREAMRQTASNAASPNNLVGWGILNTDSAIKYFGALPLGRISGTKFNDTNGNGVKDSGEPPLANAIIHLTATTTESTLTDAFGNYSFDSLAIGTYTIAEDVPAGWVQTIPSGSYSFTLLHGVDTAGLNFGIHNTTPIVSIDLQQGWNLSSLPFPDLSGSPRSSVFQTSSAAFSYDKGYILQNTLFHGVGYWLKLPTSTTVLFYGATQTADTVNVNRGWNIIGATSFPVPVSSITSDSSGTVTSVFYWWDPTDRKYKTYDTLQPGRAYWVRAQSNRRLFLSNSLAAFTKSAILIQTSDEEPPPAPPYVWWESQKLPSEYALDQNYPNPFNPTTTFNYQLLFDSKIELRVYNVLGQVVQTLVDDTEVAGYKSVEWNASNVGSGIYFYRIEATSTADPTKSFTQVKKMLLLK